ncbi:MAG: LCP family protein [Lachnospiraceae bacterium]|nr:LCP family protein [Lachnospiraceae bacterium]
MDSFDDNKIKDANMFSDEVDNAETDEGKEEDFEFEDPEEASAVSEMVKNIAEGGNGKKPAKDSDDEDEEEWVVPETTLFTKLFSGKKKSAKEKPAKEKQVKEKQEYEDNDETEEEVTERTEESSEDLNDIFDIELSFDNDTFEEKKEDVKEDEDDEEFFEIVKEEAEETDSASEFENEPVDADLTEEAFHKEAERKAAEEEAIKNDIKEMRSAVEDMMYSGETSEEREARHKKAAEIAALPVIDLSDIDFFSDDTGTGNASTDEVIDEIGEHLAMFVNDEISVKKKKWPKVVACVAGFVLLLAAFLLFTRPGHTVVYKMVARFIFSNVETVDPQQNARIDEREALEKDKDGEFIHIETPTPTPVVTPEKVENSPTPSPTPTPYVDYHPHYDPDPSVINILLIGYENYEGYKYGRSDSMMIASLDKDGGPLKLVSLMRDMYVEIPGYNDNRLNAAYYFGGPELLMETIELNFGVVCDGYAIVDYSGFESIVDYIGGVELSLTAEESEYLNTTNYISNKIYRNTIPGYQVLNGNQVVGYCRIRKVPSSNGLYMDFGRTYRQRTVLDKIFNKFKDSSLTTLYGVMMECFKYVKCSENLEPIAAECLETVVEKKMFKLETYRIPVSGHYTNAKVSGSTVYTYDTFKYTSEEWSKLPGAEVLSYDSDNADILHEYLYGGN